MPTDIQVLESSPIGVQQQFQSERMLHNAWPASADQASPMMQDSRFADLDDVSLAMRQFYQSPVRTER